MIAITEIIERIRRKEEQPVLVSGEDTVSGAEFIERMATWSEQFEAEAVGAGTICGVLGDYSPGTCTLIFALMRSRAIVVPLTPELLPQLSQLLEIASVECLYRFDSQDRFTFERLPVRRPQKLVEDFLLRGGAGLVVFTSGSTGAPKGILHDCERVARKFVEVRRGWRTVLFLLLDHFGGFNTLLSTFAYGGVAVCIQSRSPEDVCVAVEQACAELLPTTPTFLNLMLASGSYRGFDLSSVKLITYGTEVMPQATLDRLKEVFPNVQLKQTYGLSELGVLRSRSRSDASPLVKIGGPGFEIKIVDGTLHVRSEANMVGYLNAPSPFDDEGWMCTGDQVEVEGEYVRFLGRQCEVINVGGQKVFPVEVETVLLQADNISEATVLGKRHALMGQVVMARVSLARPEDAAALTERLRRFCLPRLARYKIPIRFTVVNQEQQRNQRFKKVRLVPQREEP